MSDVEAAGFGDFIMNYEVEPDRSEGFAGDFLRRAKGRVMIHRIADGYVANNEEAHLNLTERTAGEHDPAAKVRTASLHVNDKRQFELDAAGGANDFLMGYVHGTWHPHAEGTTIPGETATGHEESDALVQVIRMVAARAREVTHADKLDDLYNTWDRLRQVPPLGAFSRLFRSAAPPEDTARNLRAHYDLGNRLFDLMLRRENYMQYSSGMHDPELHGPDINKVSLRDLQTAKLAQIIESARLLQKPNGAWTNFGLGWAGLELYGWQMGFEGKIYSISPAQEQADYALEWFAEFPQFDPPEIFQDLFYKFNQDGNLDGAMDAITSIEMIEGVPEDETELFFEVCSRLLKTDGRMVLQAILTPDRHYKRYSRPGHKDLFNTYIFPGGHLKSDGAIRRASHNAGLRIVGQPLDLTESYRATARWWRANVVESKPEIIDWLHKDKGMSISRAEKFVRLMILYYATCEAGFSDRLFTDYQYTLEKAA